MDGFGGALCPFRGEIVIFEPFGGRKTGALSETEKEEEGKEEKEEEEEEEEEEREEEERRGREEEVEAGEEVCTSLSENSEREEGERGEGPHDPTAEVRESTPTVRSSEVGL